MTHEEFLSALDQQRIVKAIAGAEERTSGEIRVHVQKRVGATDIRNLAERTFERLGMTKTAERNAVLLFIASEDRAFTILGDSGIHAKVPDGFWDDVVAKLTIRFKSGEFTDGIVEAIEAAGEHLAAYFPRAGKEVNELSNEIDVSDE
ncbi:MAG TPA: TPM domain-containing protein [Thermoanaerobaculia bacterium]